MQELETSQEDIKNKFIDSISKEFKNIPIVTLYDFAEKIYLVPSVRTGDDEIKSFTSYDEVGLSDIDEFGVAIVIKKDKQTPAHSHLIAKEQLNEGDLLLSYRGSRKIKVARVGQIQSTQYVISLSSTIRIQFKVDTPLDISIMVQEYLGLHEVQNFLQSRKSQNRVSSKHIRFILTPKFLKELPIPQFTPQDGKYSFEEIFKRSRSNKKELKQFYKQVEDTYHKYDSMLEGNLIRYMTNKKLTTLLPQDSLLLEKIEVLEGELERIKGAVLDTKD